MTYLEAYRQCKSEKELKDKIIIDVFYACCINKDRLQYIDEAIKIVANERGWDISGVLDNTKPPKEEKEDG